VSVTTFILSNSSYFLDPSKRRREEMY